MAHILRNNLRRQRKTAEYVPLPKSAPTHPLLAPLDNTTKVNMIATLRPQNECLVHILYIKLLQRLMDESSLVLITLEKEMFQSGGIRFQLSGVSEWKMKWADYNVERTFLKECGEMLIKTILMLVIASTGRENLARKTLSPL
jgi:hypothetical protein